MRCTTARAVGVLTIGLVLTACGTSTPTRYYTVDAAAPAERPVGAYRGPPVQVRELRIPASMDRAELVVERGGGEVQLREFDHWAAPLERSARQALVQSLALRLPPGAVLFAGTTRPADGIDLNVEVLALRIADGNASMWIAWSAQRQPAPATALPMAAHELRLSTPSGEDAASTARAWSTLLGQLADRIAAALVAAP